MKFGPVGVARAQGAILAHSLAVDGRRIRKGSRLSADDCAALAAAGYEDVVVAQLEPGDVHEDAAAARLAKAFAGDDDGLRIDAAFTGRVNLFAERAGLVVVDAEAIARANAVHPAITIATLAQHERVAPGRMVATVKIIPFAAPERALDEVCAVAGAGIRIAAFRPLRAGLVATRLAAVKPSVLDKTAKVLGARLGTYGGEVVREVRCAHDAAEIAEALRQLDATESDITIVFGASATVDEGDEVPAGVQLAGGEILHFGMPVDPGNLLVLARRNEKPLLGAPGCARSPRENGFDWVLDRFAAGLDVTARDITAMGVGGLLMEIPSRPQPRAKPAGASVPPHPRVGALVLAAGRSSRMGGAHKLLEELAGKPMVRHAVEAALASSAAPVVVVTGYRADDVAAALDGLDVIFAHNRDYAEGLSTSLAAGLAALPAEADAAIVCLGDMPGVDAALIDRLIGAFADAGEGAICVPVSHGKRGNPVVWSRRYFAALSRVSGDVGGRALIGENATRVVEIEAGEGALNDIDTPEALAAARARRME